MRICCSQKKKKFYSKTPGTLAILHILTQSRTPGTAESSSFDLQVGEHWGQGESGAWGEQRETEKPCNLFKSRTRLLGVSHMGLCNTSESKLQPTFPRERLAESRHQNLKAGSLYGPSLDQRPDVTGLKNVMAGGSWRPHEQEAH